MRATAIALVVTALLAGTAAAAVKPETAIRYRQGLYRSIAWNFSPLADMAKGKQAFDAREAEKRAARIAATSEQLLEGFPPGSDRGAETEAKADIWRNFADFEAKMHDLTVQSNALLAAAKSGDEARFKAAFDPLKQACKACHDRYKAD